MKVALERNSQGIAAQEIPNRDGLIEMPIASFIPSMRNRASNKIRVQARTSSSGSLCGSKCHEPRDLIRRDRVSGGRSVGELRRVSDAIDRSQRQTRLTYKSELCSLTAFRV